MAEAPDATLSVAEIRTRATEVQERIQSVQVRYTVQSQNLIHVPSDDLEQAEYAYRIECARLGDLRLMSRSAIDAQSQELHVFDGKQTHTLSRGVVVQRAGMTPNMDPDYYLNEVLHLVGNRHRPNFFTYYHWYYPRALRLNHGLKRFKYVVHKKQDQVDGIWCHVLEYPGKDKLWVDTEAGCALRRHERKEHEMMSVAYRFSDLRSHASGIWAPMLVMRSLYPNGVDVPHEFRNRVQSEQTMQVESLKINQAQPEDFDPPVESGSIVVTARETNYRVAGNGHVPLSQVTRMAQQDCSFA